MAENKKSFVLYCDIHHTTKFLSDEQAGKLFKHILSYVNDENPETEDIITNISFEPIKQALKRDLKKYEKYVDKQRVNGAKGGRPKKTQKTQAFISKPKKADSVSVSVSDINNNNNIDVGEIDFWINEISNSPEYLNSFYRLNNLEKGSASKLLEDFKDHLKMNPVKHPHFSDFKKHFNNWVRKTDKSKYQFRSKGML